MASEYVAGKLSPWIKFIVRSHILVFTDNWTEDYNVFDIIVAQQWFTMFIHTGYDYRPSIKSSKKYRAYEQFKRGVS